MTQWIKLGRIFDPSSGPAWMVSHAAPPVAMHLEGNRYRVYFGNRDREKRSRVGFFEIDLEDPGRLLRVSEKPVLGLGSPGAHDDSGAMASWLVRHDETLRLYYTGWNLGRSVPFYLHVGLAVSNDGGESFGRISEGPILGRSLTDAYLAASPCVLVEEGRWRMWYVSGVRWTVEDGAAKHWYHIRYAESADGVNWRRDGTVCLDFADPGEHAFGRPSVLRDGGALKMWYPYRGTSYRIGYAESSDGLVWSRQDEHAGIAPSESGWDSEMVTYPFVFDHRGRRYMLYNGNGYGQTGIGLAVLEE